MLEYNHNTMKKYYPRLIEKKLEHLLKLFGAVVLAGPKWCGKTETCRQYAKTIYEFQNARVFERYRHLVFNDPDFLFDVPKPILFDEWQDIPEIWDLVRLEVDHHGTKGGFILTGSTTYENRKTKHTGTGRIATLQMRTMSLFESGLSNGAISLAELFDGGKVNSIVNDISTRAIIEAIVKGGWPETIDLNVSDAQIILGGYLKNVLAKDVNEIDGVRRDSQKMLALLESLARNISTQAKHTTIIEDIKANHQDITIPTYVSYLDALKKLYIIEDVPSFDVNLRSKSRIRETVKRQFCDPALACAALRIGAEDLLNDIRTCGFFFESLCIKELRVYMDILDGEVLQYHDSTGLEVDTILHLNSGKWAACEIKLGQERINEGLDNLRRFKNKLGDSSLKSLAFMAVITANGFGYTTQDGIHIIPIQCLKN